MKRTVYIRLKIMKMVFTSFMIKGMCLRNPCKTPAKEELSVNHHLNARGLDESSSRPPLPLPPHLNPSCLFLCEERDFSLFASYTYASTSRVPADTVLNFLKDWTVYVCSPSMPLYMPL